MSQAEALDGLGGAGGLWRVQGHKGVWGIQGQVLCAHSMPGEGCPAQVCDLSLSGAALEGALFGVQGHGIVLAQMNEGCVCSRCILTMLGPCATTALMEDGPASQRPSILLCLLPAAGKDRPHVLLAR